MAKYCGKDFLVKVGDGGGPENFTTIAGMRSTGMTINNEQVDVTTKDDVPWRQLLDGCGVQSMSISLSGTFTDGASHDTMMSIAMADSINNYELISGRGDKFSGAFECATLERSGEYNGEEQYSMTLESAGTITYTPAP